MLAGYRRACDAIYEKRYRPQGGFTSWSSPTVACSSDSRRAARRQRFIGLDRRHHGQARQSRALGGSSAESSAEERTLLLESERAARTAARTHERDEGRVPRDALARAAHAAQRDPRLVAGAAHAASKDEADYVKGLETIERNARVQAQLIEDLLDMSRIISGKLRLDVQPVEPRRRSSRRRVETVTPGGRRQRRSGSRSVLDPQAGPISGDPDRLQQVVWNLLSNAIKFTPKGGKVQVVLQRVNSHVEITVGDTGMGIKPEVLPHVFERFRQADASTTTRSTAGSGWACRSSSSLVELHGGTVRGRERRRRQGRTFVGAPAAQRGPRDRRRRRASIRRRHEPRRRRLPARGARRRQSAGGRRRARRTRPRQARARANAGAEVLTGRLGRRGARGAGRERAARRDRERHRDARRGRLRAAAASPRARAPSAAAGSRRSRSRRSRAPRTAPARCARAFIVHCRSRSIPPSSSRRSRAWRGVSPIAGGKRVQRRMRAPVTLSPSSRRSTASMPRTTRPSEVKSPSLCGCGVLPSV